MSDDLATHRILVIDDQAAIHEDYRKILGRQGSGASAALGQAAAELFGDDPGGLIEWEGFEVDSAYQGKEGLELVERAVAEGRPYAMAFVDIRMPPGWDGVETVRHIWEVDPEILVVICSAYSDYTWHELVRELGRNDRYLILKKPFDNIEVRQCAMALTERWSVSRTDALTGLLNRRAFLSYLHLEWDRSTRHRFPLACAMLDLDGFKQINDTLGHLAGDQALRAIARAIKSNCRSSDSVCRFGGDEICVLLPHTTAQEAAVWAEHTRRALASAPVAIGGKPVPITVSVGVAERSPDDDRVERLVDRADQALMRSKALGRNRLVLYGQAAPTADALDDRPSPVEGPPSVIRSDVLAPLVICTDFSIDARHAAPLGPAPLPAPAAQLVESARWPGIAAQDDVSATLSIVDVFTAPLEPPCGSVGPPAPTSS